MKGSGSLRRILGSILFAILVLLAFFAGLKLPGIISGMRGSQAETPAETVDSPSENEPTLPAEEAEPAIQEAEPEAEPAAEPASPTPLPIPDLSGLAIEGEEMTLESGDTCFIPSPESMVLDTEALVAYFPHLMKVYLSAPADEAFTDQILAAAQGAVIAQAGDRFLQLKIQAETYEEIEEACRSVNTLPGVILALPELPSSTHLSEYSEPFNYTPGQDGEGPAVPDRISDSCDELDPEGNDWWAEAIGAYRAWDATDPIETTAYVKTGVIDGGIDPNHEDLAAAVYKLYGGADNSNVHGTHVSGLIGANKNKSGIRGVNAYSELVLATLDINSLSASTLLVNYARQMIRDDAVRVINMSLNSSVYSAEYYNSGNIKPADILDKACYDRAVDYSDYCDLMHKLSDFKALELMGLMEELRAAGIENYLFVQSAGNGEAGDVDAPSDAKTSGYIASIREEVYDVFLGRTSSTPMTFEQMKAHCLIVGAIDKKADGETLYPTAPFSNYGSTIDLYAPGVDILSAAPGNLYAKHDGTSMASPIVTGAVSLVWSLNEDLSYYDVRKIILEEARDAVAAPEGTTTRLLDVGNAALRALNEPFAKQLKTYKGYLAYSGERTGTYVNTGNPYMPEYNWGDNTDCLPLTFLIRDLDDDGQDELLVMETDADFSLRVCIFEEMNGEAVLAASREMEYTVNNYGTDRSYSLYAVPGKDTGYISLFTYKTGGSTAFCLQSRNDTFLLADGIGIHALALRYDGTNLTELGGFYEAASDVYGYTDELAARFAPMGISLTGSQFLEIFEGRSELADFAEESAEFARVEAELLPWVDYQTVAADVRSGYDTLEVTNIDFHALRD